MCIQCYEVAGEKQRFKILSLLKGRKELCVADVAKILKVSQPTATHHLKLLLDVGLVSVERRGKERWYSLNRESECFSECGMLEGLIPTKKRK